MNPIVIALVLLSLIGCEKQQARNVHSSEVTSAAQSKALAARADLFGRLSTRLSEVIESQGPAAAIEVCSNEASQIAQSIGNHHGVKIGRTSLKLRNQKNIAPKWAVDLLSESATDLQFLQINESTVGALIPIMLQKKCLTCHGPVDSLAPSLKERLANFYPADEATGFKEGELRGWFWVEVPLPQKAIGG